MLMNLYGKANTSEMVTVICGFKNIHFLAPRFLIFFSSIFTSKVLRIGAAERSWGDVKTNKSGKRSAISNDVLEKQRIFYTSTCIESARIEQYHSEKQLNDNCSSHTCNEEDDAFDHQLKTMGCEESIFRTFRTY